MIPLDAGRLLDEVKDAETDRKKYWKNVAALVKRFVGNYYRDEMRGKPVPENLIFSFIASTLPELAFDKPAVSVSAKRIITHKAVAEWMKMGFEGWIKEVGLRAELEMAAVDFLFGYCVFKIGLEERGDFMANTSQGVYERFNMDALIPYLIRVEPEDFIIDPQAKSFRRARYMGMRFARDLDELKNDQRYDQNVVAGLTADNEQPNTNGASSLSPKQQTASNRDRVTLYELYLAEHKMLCTIALNAAGKADFVRAPTPYIGPPAGPYIMSGAYYVPNKAYPLSPIQAMYEQFAELNAHATAAAVEAGTHKRVAVCNSNNPATKATIDAAPTGSIVGIPNFSAQELAQLDIGGTSEFRLAYIEQLRARCDRVSGQGDQTRGRMTNGTATESQIVQSASDSRTDFIKLKFREAVSEAFKGVGWYMFYDPAVVFPVSRVDPVTSQPFEGYFLGGQQDGQEDLNWLDFFLDIEPYSMARIDPQQMQQQANLVLQTAVQVAPMIVQFPFLNWREILDMLGEANNIPDFADRVLNQSGLQMIQSGVAFGQVPGQLPGLQYGDPNLPPGTNPNLQAGMGGAPVGGMMPQRSGGGMGGGSGMGGFTSGMANLNPGVAAGQQLGYFGAAGAGGMNAAPAGGMMAAAGGPAGGKMKR